MTSKALALAAAGSLILCGCSSRPRNFAPVLSAAPVDQQAYEAKWHECRQQVAATAKAGSGRGGSAAGGAVAGAGGAVAMGAATAGTYATYAGAAAALGATIVAAPIAGIVGAWGISRMKKDKKEKAIKAATAQCLADAGYTVEGWRVLSKEEVRALPAPALAPPPLAEAPKD